MLNPYREPLETARIPLEQIEWRRTVSLGAGLVVLFLLAGVAAIPLAITKRQVATTCFLALRNLCVVAATWMLTAPAPGQRPSRLAWSLRASVVVQALLGPFIGLKLLPRVLTALPGFAVSAFGLAYVARLFETVEDRRHARQARWLIAPLAADPLLAAIPWTHWSGPAKVPAVLAALALSLAGFIALIWAFVLLLRVRRQTAVVGHAWWFDSHATLPGEWLSLLLYRDGHAEVIAADGQLALFSSKRDARTWLINRGFLGAARAVRRGLAAVAPPPILASRPEPRSRRE